MNLRDFMKRGADATFGAVIPTQALVCGAVSRQAVVTPAAQTRQLRDSGLWPEATSIAVLKRCDFLALGIVDRSVVQTNGLSMQVLGIDDDPDDATVTLHLKRDHS